MTASRGGGHDVAAWRVTRDRECDGSQARLRFNSGTLTAKSTDMPQTVLEYRQRVAEHIRSGQCRMESCFLSAFDNRDKAEKWAFQRYRWTLNELRRRDARHIVYEVDTIMLKQRNIHVFKLGPLLNLRQPECDVSDEFLDCLDVHSGRISGLNETCLGFRSARRAACGQLDWRGTIDGVTRTRSRDVVDVTVWSRQ